MDADQLVAVLIPTALIPATRVTADDNTLALAGTRAVPARSRLVLLGASSRYSKLVPTPR